MSSAGEKRGIIPIGGPVAGPVHDRSLGGLLGGLLGAGTAQALGVPLDSGHGMAILTASGGLGAYIGSLVPEQYRAGIQAVLMFVVSVFAGGMLSGCSAQNGQPRDLRRDCDIAQAVYVGFQPVLAAKCAKAEDPLSDPYCIANSAAFAAVQVCYAAAGNGDEAGVREAVLAVGEQRPGAQ